MDSVCAVYLYLNLGISSVEFTKVIYIWNVCVFDKRMLTFSHEVPP